MNLTDLQRTRLCELWPFEGEIRFHRRVANFVYFATLEKRPVVLRLTEPHYRKRTEIESELDWVSFLADKGLTVARPLRSRNGLPVETVEESGTCFHAAVFTFAPGARLEAAALDEAMVGAWGSFLGRMHRLAQEYVPGPGVTPRPQWQDDANLKLAQESLDAQDPVAYARYHQLFGWLSTLPRVPASYGLIHCDLHNGNFHVANGTLHVFDFDDSHYHWFCFDLIPALHAAEELAKEATPAWPAHRARDIFLAGYLRENRLEPVWLDRLPLFEKFRAVYRYLWVKTALRNRIFDAKGIEWAKQALPEALATFSGPLELY